MILLNLSLLLLASAPNYIVGPDEAITSDPTLAHWESSLAVSDRDPHRLVVSCNATSVDPKEKLWTVQSYWSNDGGENWRQSNLVGPPPLAAPAGGGGARRTGVVPGTGQADLPLLAAPAEAKSPSLDLPQEQDDTETAAGIRLGDGTIAFGPSSEVYCAALCSFPKGKGRGVAVFASKDYGETFGPLVLPFEDPFLADHEMIIVDRTKSKYRGRLYVAAEYTNSTVRVNTSSDGGKTFETAVAVSPWKQGFVDNLCVFSDGTLFVPIRTQNKFQTDAKGSWAGSKATCYCVTSNDGGKTFTMPSKIYDHVELPTKTGGGGGSSVYAVGRYRGKERVYCIWSDTHTRICRTYLAYSEDKGQTWSDPGDITPVVANTTAGVANIAVAPNGMVGISWLSTGHGALKGDQLYFAASRDGGKTFMEPVPIDPTRGPSDSPGSMRYNGGDYTFMSCGPDNTFHPLWQDTRTGVFQLHTRSVRVGR